MSRADSALGGYLRARRDALSPSAAGIVDDAARRVTGLRRQEVANLAGISSEYYLRLEQGKDRQPSGQVLLALGRALHLDPDGMSYLFRLAGQVYPSGTASPATADRVPSAAGGLSAGLTALLDQWSGTPAYVLDRNQDVLGVNDLGREFLPFPAGPGMNLIELTAGYADADGADHRDHWDRLLADHVRALRYWGDPADPRLQLLVASLSSRSRVFRQVWEAHEARPFRSGMIAAEVAPFGYLRFNWQVLEVPGRNQFLFAYFGDPQSPASAAAIDYLRAKVRVRQTMAHSGSLPLPPDPRGQA